MEEKTTLSLHSFNVRGLANKNKRTTIFNWLSINHKGIIFLQETHTTKDSENTWRQEWPGEIIFSHGNFNSRGVAILFPKQLDVTVNSQIVDGNGRYILADVTIEDNKLILVNLYAPTKDKVNDQIYSSQKLQIS